MELKDFRLLKELEKVKIVNERLLSLKSDGKTVKDFKNDLLEFSYPTCVSEMNKLGYARDGDIFSKEVKLTDYEIRTLKNLAYAYEFVMQRNREQPKVIKRADDTVTTTSARVYNKVWKRWQLFCQDWSIFNSIDLMASALEEFMDNNHFESYDTLSNQGKIHDFSSKKNTL